MTARALHSANRGARDPSGALPDGSFLARILARLADSILLPMVLLALALIAFVSLAHADDTAAGGFSSGFDSRFDTHDWDLRIVRA